MYQVQGETTQNSSRRVKVLLVDDDQMVHETLGAFLKDTDFDLISAMEVHSATRMIRSEQPDIIITDAMMPGESGFTLIGKLKSRPETSSIPVILATVLEEANGGVMDASGKADITISKPFYRSEIMACLEKARQMTEYGVTVVETPAFTFSYTM